MSYQNPIVAVLAAQLDLKEVRVEKRAIELDRYRKRLASEEDCSLRIEEPCALYIGESTEPAVIYLELDQLEETVLLAEVCAELEKVRFPTKQRTAGMISTSRVFGYLPRNIVHGKEACHTSSLTYAAPDASAALCSLAQLVAHYYRLLNPQRFALHEHKVASVLDAWKLTGSPFTSGIVNKDNQLPYHFDAGNFSDVWSNMICFKKDIVGGNLSCPEIDTTFVLRNNSLIMFDGQGLLHGVTPFRKRKPSGYRYTLVYYSLLQMWQCKAPGEEIREAAKRRRLRELGRSEHAQNPTPPAEGQE